MLVRTDYAETPWITPGRVYEAELVTEGRFKGLYMFYGDSESPVYITLTKSVHIGLNDWEIVE